MGDLEDIHIAIVDYGLGNLFSVRSACEFAGMQATITSSRHEIRKADAILLPGVGAFGDAMESLAKLDLAGPLRDAVLADQPLIGICLGMQLLMSESFEFGRHRGLDLIKGSVVRFDNRGDDDCDFKVPQVGWNRIFEDQNGHSWSGTLLDGLRDGEFVYFVHSFYVKPDDPNVILSLSRYGNTEFCSSLRYRNTYGFQFHPERSGYQGLKIYQNLATLVIERRKIAPHAST